MNEVAYYPELALCLEEIIRANLTNDDITVRCFYLPNDGHNIRSYLEGYLSDSNHLASRALQEFALDVPKIRTDLAILVDNPVTNKFKIILVEAKLLGSAGLTELSQLIGYCLVTKVTYGILVNINGGVSNELAHILTTDEDVMKIERKLAVEDQSITHKIGVMTYHPQTRNLSYIPTSAINSLPQVIEEIESSIS